MDYFAFISYKRGGIDEKVANWIHTKLEKYPYPLELVATENRPTHETLIRPVFIDTKDLHVEETEFTDEIKEVLECSKYLIVICSKVSAQSEFVNQEVEYFLQTHNNDYGKILPVFIDTVEDGLPKALRNANILSRHCPIYNSFLDPKNEINLYCFYHVVAFLLKVDFRSIYDRYKRYAAKKNRRIKILKNGFYSIIAIGVILLVHSVYSQYRLIQTKDHLIRMEKQVFPYSVVVGYTDNFLSPVTEYLREHDSDAQVYIHMPIHKEDIENHSERVLKTRLYIKDCLSKFGLDSISPIKLATRMKRGSTILKLYSSTDEKLNSIYIDFATTTSTFLKIAEEKKKSDFIYYTNLSVDSMINEYAIEFVKQAKKELKDDSLMVSFITDEKEIVNKFAK